EGLDAQLPGYGNNLPQFFELLHDHDHALAEFRSEQGHPHEIRVLVAVAHDEAAQLALQGQPGEQFRLAADLQAEIERLAGIEDFFHDFAQLIYLDWKNASIASLVIEFVDRIAKRHVDGFDTMPKDVLETNQHGKL